MTLKEFDYINCFISVEAIPSPACLYRKKVKAKEAKMMSFIWQYMCKI